MTIALPAVPEPNPQLELASGHPAHEGPRRPPQARLLPITGACLVFMCRISCNVPLVMVSGCLVSLVESRVPASPFFLGARNSLGGWDIDRVSPTLLRQAPPPPETLVFSVLSLFLVHVLCADAIG